MRITLNEPELELEVNQVDTPTGAGWCVKMPDDKKILVKLQHGKWETEDIIGEQFLQDVGSEISRVLEADQLGRVHDNYSVLNTRPKRARIPKYFLI